MEYIDILAEELGIIPDEVETPRKVLDETTPGTGDVSGGSMPAPVCLQPNIAFSDLSLNENSDCSSYICAYAFTFTYDPESIQMTREIREQIYLSPEDEEYKFWEVAVGGKKKFKTRTQKMKYFPFMHQYDIFKKHFLKSWLPTMRKMIYGSILGYTVCVEQTKAGLIHAHGIFYSDNPYTEMVCQTARVLWAKTSKGRVCAMKNAFESVSSVKSWKKYITKNL